MPQVIFGLLLYALSVVACGQASAGDEVTPPADSSPCQTLEREVQQPIIVLIGGNHSDPSPEQLAGKSGRSGNSGLWRLKGDLHDEDQLCAEYFNWNGTRAGQIDTQHPAGAHAIARLIRQQHAERPGAPIILVGNSWGGHTAWQVCQLLNGKKINEKLGSQHSIDSFSGRVTSSAVSGAATTTAPDTVQEPPQDNKALLEVDLLVLLDPSSFGRGTAPVPPALPDNVQSVINYHTRNSFGWRGWVEDDRLTNIDLGDPANGFLVPGGGKYDAVLNWSAHVSAEWDEKIHAAIREQIRQVATPSEDSASSSDSSSEPRR